MQGKKILIGIVAFVLAMVFAFMFVIAPIDAVAGRITIGDYYSKSTLLAIVLFLCSSIASCCFFNKIGQKILHSAGSAVLIGLLGLLVAGVFYFFTGRNIDNIIINHNEMADIIKKAVISAVGMLGGGFIAGFGMTTVDFSKRGSKEEGIHTVERAHTDDASISKTVGAILAFLFGGLGIHRYYLGYKKQGAIQTCGFISLVIAYSLYIYGDDETIGEAILLVLLGLYGAATSVWAFVDIIRILTGGLQPANGNTYAENRPQQVQIVQPKETASDTVDAIAKLAKLREQGILNDEEFQSKKTELLKKM